MPLERTKMTANEQKHREFILRWLPARQAYMQGRTIAEIAQIMGVRSVKAMDRRVVRFRKKFGWFMLRLEFNPVSNLGVPGK